MHIWDQYISAGLQFWFHQMPFGLGDDVWWPLVMYGETVVHHLLFLVGELLIWFTFTFYTKHWCPLAAFDICHCWMAAWVGPGWVGPWAWGCPAGILATWPWCHLSKNTKMSFTRKLKTFNCKQNKLIKFHSDIIIYYGWYLYYYSNIHFYYEFDV